MTWNEYLLRLEVLLERLTFSPSSSSIGNLEAVLEIEEIARALEDAIRAEA